MESEKKYLLKKIGLLVIGDEILLGRRQDKHVVRARDYFGRLNVDISWITILGDDPDLLERHFRLIRERGDDCFSFGGIGATPDDMTLFKSYQLKNKLKFLGNFAKHTVRLPLCLN